MAVFTFQSAVHSAHVLECLNEQRQRDILCDVTVVVENKSFRAHCSVLASCSEYFHSRVTSVTSQNSVIVLSDEVTAEGFEPLLQFAYTSKLPFTRENIHAVHSSAEFLGFHTLESACFDFLLPKFSGGKNPPQEVGRRGCCLALDSVAGGGQATPPVPHSSAPFRGNEPMDFPSRSAEFQVNNREEAFCLENCGPQIPSMSLELPSAAVCPMLPLPCPDPDKENRPSTFCERDILEIGDVCAQAELSLADCGLACPLATVGGMNPQKHAHLENGNAEHSVETLAADIDCGPAASCPLSTSAVADCSGLIGQSVGCCPEGRLEGDLSGPALTSLGPEQEFEERSSVEREVAEHLAKGLWSNLSLSQTQAGSLDSTEQNNLSKASDFHWLKQLDLSASVGDCPFFKDLESANDQPAHAEEVPHSKGSPCVSSSLNSGEDSELDSDGDSETNSIRAAEMQLPFSVEQISALSRKAFQQLLKHNKLSKEQLEFVHDIRRRSKNRAAARRCRKRKVDSIQQLQSEVKKLRGEKAQLLQEQSELKKNLAETRQKVSGLYNRLSGEYGGEEQLLQILAKCSWSPSAVFASSPLSGEQEEEEESQSTLKVVSTSECSQSALPGESQKSDESEGAPAGDCGSQESFPDPVSLIKDCLALNNIL